MIKGLGCIALLFAVLVAAHGCPDHDSPDHDGPDHDSPDHDGPDHDSPDHDGPDHDSPDHDGPNHGVPRPSGDGFKGQWSAKLCANQTTANSFLTQIQQLINTLQSNGSFAQVLADRAQELAYIQNSANTALLSSNCTGYFHSLENAQNADRVALEAKQQYYRIAADAMMRIIRNLLGGSKYKNYA